MARICPNCGRQAIDDQSQFCNKCGTPFPTDQPKKVLVRTTPRFTDTRPAAPPDPLAYREPAAPPGYDRPAAAVSPAPSLADPPRARAPPAAKRPVQRQPLNKTSLPFGKFYGKENIRTLYWIGILAILLVVFAGITSGPAGKSASGTGAATNTTAAASGDLLATLPLFWIGILVFSVLFWRILCETSAVLFALHESRSAPHIPRIGPGDPLYGEESAGSGDAGEDNMVSCPRCGKIVPADEMKICSHCGVEGCSSCIRLMGLIKKDLTCRDCYQK